MYHLTLRQSQEVCLNYSILFFILDFRMYMHGSQKHQLNDLLLITAISFRHCTSAYFADKNNKSEPIPNEEKVRISTF